MSTPAERLHETLTSEHQKPFVIENKEQAAWAMRKLAGIEKEKAEVYRVVSKEVSRIEQWAEGEIEALDNNADFFRNLLIQYLQQIKEANPKTKSIKLPHGVIKSKKMPDQWKVQDEVTLAYLKENRPDLVKTKITETPDKQGLKKTVKVVEGQALDPETGEVIPGVTVLDGGEKYTVDVEV